MNKCTTPSNALLTAKLKSIQTKCERMIRIEKKNVWNDTSVECHFLYLITRITKTLVEKLTKTFSKTKLRSSHTIYIFIQLCRTSVNQLLHNKYWPEIINSVNKSNGNASPNNVGFIWIFVIISISRRSLYAGVFHSFDERP